ncbi:MAG: MBL fold metallo-hydrolase [Actinomycetota bacterium]|nr:MBL fold metallo-hydrolase [Actinomycetota bacterium]
MISPRRAVGDLWALASSQPAPGHGILPVNAYLFRGDSPVLVDTGLSAERDDFLEKLWSLVPPARLAAVFLTHEDADHAGNLFAVLEAAPQARLVTNYVTVAKLQEAASVPLDRVQVVNPGQRVPGAEGRLTAVRPPVYDAPGTLGLHDRTTGAVLTVDAFGTYLPEPVKDLRDLDEADVLRGLADFNRMNHPWTALADQLRFDAAVAAVADLRPTLLLSSHGVVAGDRTDLLLEGLRALPGMDPYVPPDQPAFEHLKTEMGG